MAKYIACPLRLWITLALGRWWCGGRPGQKEKGGMGSYAPKAVSLHYIVHAVPALPPLSLCSNPRRACAARVTVVGSVCVCVSVKSHLTYGASVRPENAVTYSAGNEGQKICGVFSETAPLQRSSTPSVVRLLNA